MNPFELRGPEYLAFYAGLTIVVAILVVVLRRSVERTDSGSTYSRTAMTDPYLIAFLRGGKDQVIRTAAISLVDRGLLEARDDEIVTSARGHNTPPRQLVEKELLAACAHSRKAADLFSEVAFEIACSPYEEQLRGLGLLPDVRLKTTRWMLFASAVAVLGFFSVVKITIGLQRGRPIAYLVVLSVVALIVVAMVSFPHRTARGNQYMGELQNLFASLRLRSPHLEPGGASADLALLIAVFGIGELDAKSFRWTRSLFRKASSSGTLGCGSSSSSCGGGGGGCGGCGS